MSVKISGWGKNVSVHKNIYNPKNNEEIIDLIFNKKISNFITRGLGRSYGDSSLADNVVSLKDYNKFFNFNEKDGFIECSSNYSLNELIKIILQKGWFFKVTPGSKFVTIGGAIASDVHGKNHHLDGSFANHVMSLKVITAEGKLYNCSKDENKQLFHATCGGMGLTGIIVSAKIKLLRIKSKFIDVQILKTKNLKETITKFKELSEIKYTIAWIDTSSKTRDRGRSVIFIGNHSDDGDLEFYEKKKISIPSNFPGIILNKYTIKLFNKIYYYFHKDKKKFKQNLDSFFYPLDYINNWNNLYGKNGFTQIQILIQEEDPEVIINKVLDFFQEKGQYSFLSTLKEFGKGNENYLSFPDKGYTLTMDLKMNKKLKKIYEEFENLLIGHKVKVYLTKDSLMTEKYFKETYMNYNKFKEIKNKHDPMNLVNSFQSFRINI